MTSIVGRMIYSIFGEGVYLKGTNNMKYFESFIQLYRIIMLLYYKFLQYCCYFVS